MSTYDALAPLPVTVDGYRLERREMEVSSGFTRVTTTVVLEGGGAQGQGEDVTYDAADHGAGPAGLDLTGPRTLDELSRLLGSSTSSRARRRSARCRATTAAGRSRAPPSISRSARPGRRSGP